MSEWSVVLAAAAKASPWLSAVIALMLLAKPLVAIWMVLKLAPPSPDMEVRVKAGSFEIEFRAQPREQPAEEAELADEPPQLDEADQPVLDQAATGEPSPAQ